MEKIRRQKVKATNEFNLLQRTIQNQIQSQKLSQFLKCLTCSGTSLFEAFVAHTVLTNCTASMEYDRLPVKYLFFFILFFESAHQVFQKYGDDYNVLVVLFSFLSDLLGKSSSNRLNL